MILEPCKTAIEMNRPGYLFLYENETRRNALLFIENVGLDDNVFKVICNYVMNYEYATIEQKTTSDLNDLKSYFKKRPPGIKDDLLYIHNFRICKDCYEEFTLKIKDEFFSQNYTDGQQTLLF